MSSSKPSPHRFLTHRPQQKQPTKPPSNLRHAFPAPVQTPKPKSTPGRIYEFPDEAPRVTPAKRFVIAPPRPAPTPSAKGKDKAAAERRNVDTYEHDSVRKKPVARTLERVESIEGSSQTIPSASAETGQDGNNPAEPNGQRQTFDEDNGQVQEDNDDAEMLFHSENHRKRRRVSPPPEHSSSPNRPSSSRSMHHPQTPVQTTATSASSHRFIIPAPKIQTPFSNVSTTSQTPQPHNRPHFLLPPQQTIAQQPAQPLPEHFSPSRKGQKYVPGGLASTVQSWIIETASTGFAAQTRDAVVWGRDKEEGVKMRVTIRSIVPGNGHGDEDGGVECVNGAVVLVRGDTDIGLSNASYMPPESARPFEHETRVLLAGQGGARGHGGVKIKERSVIGLRAPLWDVDIAGETWVVAVDWILL